jgi:hypothetical protein
MSIFSDWADTKHGSKKQNIKEIELIIFTRVNFSYRITDPFPIEM